MPGSEKKKARDRERMKRIRLEQKEGVDAFVSAIEALEREESFPVHVGYDEAAGGGNFVYADVVRKDSDAFVRLMQLYRAHNTREGN